MRDNKIVTLYVGGLSYKRLSPPARGRNLDQNFIGKWKVVEENREEWKRLSKIVYGSKKK